MDHHHSRLREKKAIAASLDQVDDKGLFEGYACLFGKEDLGRDIIRAGAFRQSLTKRGSSGVKLLYQHDPAQPIGHWLTIREDDRGLFVRGQLALDVEKAREVHAMMQAGILDGLSIGFRTVKGHKDTKSGARHLLELDLWEISVVTFPMQPDARISSVKSDSADASPAFGTFSKRNLERKLMQDAGFSRSQARALLAHGFSGLTGKQDAVSTGHPSQLNKLHRLTLCMHEATRSLIG
nr:HK97 family phage prohead protease [uncultured Cohaesibacter sp.]